MPVSFPPRPAALAAAALVLAVLSAPALAKKEKEEGGLIRGRVVGAGEATVAGVAVTISTPEGEARWSGTTDDEGRFEARLPAGSYRLAIADAERGDYEAPIELAEDEKLDVEIALEDAAMAARNQAIQAYNAGVNAHRGGDAAGALPHFRKAVELDPELVQAWLGIADLELRRGDAAAAVAAVEAYRVRRPDEATGRRLAFEAYLASGAEDKAKELAPALTGDPEAKGLAVRVYNLGAEAWSRREAERAVSRFELALTLDPSLAPAYVALATAHYDAERYEEAEAAIDGLLGVDPASVPARRLRYLVADAQGDLDAAHNAFVAYKVADAPAAAELLYRRAELDFRGGETAAAKDALEEVLAIVPDHPRAHYTRGLVAASEGDNPTARRHLQRFLALAPDDPEAATAREMLKQL